MSVLKLLEVMRSEQHDEGSQNLTGVVMAVWQAADHEDFPPARVSHETVTELVKAMKYSGYAQTEVMVRGLVIN